MCRYKPWLHNTIFVLACNLITRRRGKDKRSSRHDGTTEEVRFRALIRNRYKGPYARYQLAEIR